METWFIWGLLNLTCRNVRIFRKPVVQIPKESLANRNSTFNPRASVSTRPRPWFRIPRHDLVYSLAQDLKGFGSLDGSPTFGSR